MSVTGIYINIPVTDVAKSREFFEGIGFSVFEPYSGPANICLELNQKIRIMLTAKEQFEAMMAKPAADKRTSEVLISLTCDTPEAVKSIAEKALALGARKINDFEENEFMHTWGFEDLDGHVWDLHCFKR